jgi:hypothetical protein
MSVNGILWAKKSNTYYECDRDRNFTLCLYSEEGLTFDEVEKYDDLINNPHIQPNCITGWGIEDTLFIIASNIKSALAGMAKDPAVNGHDYWIIPIFHNSKMPCMLSRLRQECPPDEEFYFYTDNDDEYYDVRDKAKPHYVTEW